MIGVQRNHRLRLEFIEIKCLRLGVERNYLLGVHRNHRLRLGVEKLPVTDEPVEFEK